MWGLEIIAVVAAEWLEVGVNTMSKTAMRRGMNNFVYSAYSTSIGVLFLLPLTFIFHRITSPPPQLTLCILCKLCLLGVIGYCVQMFMYFGIEYSSPTMASALINLTPAFTFILARITRMEKLDLKTKSSQAKTIGTLTSIIGAFTVTFYQGPPLVVFTTATPTSLPYKILPVPPQPQLYWVIGGFLLAAGSFSLAVLFIVQAIFMVSFRNVVSSWVLRKKGPVFVTMFRPLAMVIALVMGIAFLGDSFYLGSLIGAFIIAIGFYLVLWGKAEEERVIEDRRMHNFDSPSHKLPLLPT